MITLQEAGAIDIESVRSYMLQYLADGSRSYSEPYFTVSEVHVNSYPSVTYLFKYGRIHNTVF